MDLGKEALTSLEQHIADHIELTRLIKGMLQVLVEDFPEVQRVIAAALELAGPRKNGSD